MQIWVADELGQIKSCLLEDNLGDGNPLSSETIPVSSAEKHGRGDYVQIMAHAKFAESDKVLLLLGAISTFSDSLH